MFYETEQAHHQFASFLDPDHPLYDESYEGKVKRVYEKIDNELATLLDTIGDEDVIIMSDHGFCPIYDQINVNRILERAGYYTPSESTGGRHGITEKMVLETIRIAKDNNVIRKATEYAATVPVLEEIVQRVVGGYQNIEYGKHFDVTWSNTRAFNAYEHGGIYINTTDEPRGIVPPEERSDLVNQVIEALWADDRLAARVDNIYRREELFDGDQLERLPDIVIDFSDGHLGQWVYNEELFLRPEEIKAADKYIGFHTHDGLCLAKGPSISRGRLEGASIMDVAPTVLHYFGLPVPERVDGSPLSSIFSEASEFNTREVERTSAERVSRSDKELTEQEIAEIESNLQQMGYK
jgi:predicted AlkP superfamily phosphohydrolase/phosphomutase